MKNDKFDKYMGKHVTFLCSGVRARIVISKILNNKLISKTGRDYDISKITYLHLVAPYCISQSVLHPNVFKYEGRLTPYKIRVLERDRDNPFKVFRFDSLKEVLDELNRLTKIKGNKVTSINDEPEPDDDIEADYRSGYDPHEI